MQPQLKDQRARSFWESAASGLHEQHHRLACTLRFFWTETSTAIADPVFGAGAIADPLFEAFPPGAITAFLAAGVAVRTFSPPFPMMQPVGTPVGRPGAKCPPADRYCSQVMSLQF